MQPLNGFLQKHEKRVVGLDILRTVAILVVVYTHGIGFFTEDEGRIYRKIKGVLNLDGVSIFFVLSGFLIGGILLRMISQSNFTKKDLLNFWIRRWFRTIPNYVLVYLGLILFHLVIFHQNRFNIRYLLFIQNFSFPGPDFFPEAWSLCVEEWFYLLFPLLCFVLHKSLKNKSKAVVIAAITFLVFPLVTRIWMIEHGFPKDPYEFDEGIRKVMLLRLDGLMYGVIAAYVYFRHAAFWTKYKHVFLALGIGLVLLLWIEPSLCVNSYRAFRFNIESITTFCFLPVLSTYKTTRIKQLDAFFIFISLISYSMYLLNLTPIEVDVQPILVHFLNFHVLNRVHLAIPPTPMAHLALFFFLTIFSSYWLYRLYEHPMTNLRDKLKATRRPRPVVERREEVGRPGFSA